MLLMFCLVYSLYISLPISGHPNYLQMICAFPDWLSLILYGRFKSLINATEVIGFFRVEYQGWVVGGWDNLFQ